MFKELSVILDQSKVGLHYINENSNQIRSLVLFTDKTEFLYVFQPTGLNLQV